MSAAPAYGDVVAQRYRLISPVGRGGMGVVWSAEHLVLGRPVAVKFVTRGRSDDLRRAQRFVSEAKAAATVRHPNVVDILDFGVSEGGQPYMVMELLEGVSLRARLAATPPPSIGAFLDYVDGALAGLAAVHDAGLIHRDLKPENLFLAERPEGIVPKLLDFGLSRVVQDERVSHDAVTLTQEDQLLGTPTFMSPEQVRQLDDVDARADVWGAGVLLYAALGGKLPFDAPKVMDLLFEITRGEVPEPLVAFRPEVGPALSAVVARAMERDRDVRYASARELRQALLAARGVSEGALAEPARPIPASLRNAPDASASGSRALPGADDAMEILTLKASTADDSRIRERTAPKGSRANGVALAIGLVAATAAVTWWWLEVGSKLETETAPPTPVATPTPPPVPVPPVAVPVAPEAKTASAGGQGPGTVAPADTTKHAPATRSNVPPARGKTKLFRKPDY